jgi:hypothetical protein
MKGPKGLLVLALTGVALLALWSPAPAQKTRAYTTFVACGYDIQRPQTIRRTHFCPAGEVIGAFFRRNIGEPRSLVYYTVCVAFSQGGTTCKSRQPARKLGRRLYVNRIINPGPGRHKVTWFVKGERVGLWFFRRGR